MNRDCCRSSAGAHCVSRWRARETAEVGLFRSRGLTDTAGPFRWLKTSIRFQRRAMARHGFLSRKGIRMRSIRFQIAVLILSLVSIEPATAGIEAVKGKQYKLGKQHGPWMVMVAAIRDVEEEGRRTEGLTARQVADELVYELRCQGIPAYTYSMDKEVAEVSSPSLSETGQRRYVAQHGYISVLAGNFPSNSDKTANKLLNYIKGDQGRGLTRKSFEPEVLKNENSGGILPVTPGRPSPLSRAFLTINPLWEGEVQNSETSALIADLNSGQRYSLLQNPGKYSLVVATFTGSSVVQVSNTKSAGAMNYFDRTFGTSLDNCAENAIVLTEHLRNAKKHGYDQNYEAWVFHDRYRSVVTIGSFSSPEDPRIRQLITQFSVKTVRHPETGKDVQIAEIFSVPRMPKQGDPPAQTWLFDASPRPIKVPSLR